MHVGGELRAAREQQGLSLDELSARTKIGLERLKAIEDEEVDRLPPVVYLKGFVARTRPRLVWIPPQRPSATCSASISMPSANSSRKKQGTFFDEPASSDEHDTLQERHDEELLPESPAGDLPLRNVEDARGELRARVHGATDGRALGTWSLL